MVKFAHMLTIATIAATVAAFIEDKGDMHRMTYTQARQEFKQLTNNQWSAYQDETEHCEDIETFAGEDQPDCIIPCNDAVSNGFYEAVESWCTDKGYTHCMLPGFEINLETCRQENFNQIYDRCYYAGKCKVEAFSMVPDILMLTENCDTNCDPPESNSDNFEILANSIPLN